MNNAPLRKDWMVWRIHIIWRPMPVDNRHAYTERGILTWRTNSVKTLDIFTPWGLLTLTRYITS